MRLAFMGTPDFSVSALDALVDAGHQIAAVYSQPPRKSGRGHKVVPSPVHQRADALGLSVRTPLNFKEEGERQAFEALNLDAAVVVAYGLILPKAVLDAPVHGCFNIHASLLPRWRGAAPIQRAIEAGDAESGVTIMQMDVGLDTGDMVLMDRVPINLETTGQALHDALSAMGAHLMVEGLERLKAGTLTRTPQPEDGVTYAKKLDKAESDLDWTQPAEALARKVRAFYPWPGTRFFNGADAIKVLTADVVNGSGKPGSVLDDQLTIACGERALRPTLLQRPGKGPQPADAFLRGYPIDRDSVLTVS